ncbi:MAG: sugar ABC transporter permease [Acetobacteraceae bacterium]|nr:sugar ABC transporter permease [Acetobacteraceae bacterium]
MRFRLSDRQVGVLFMLPLLVSVALFLVWPIVEAIRLSFVRYNPLRPDDQPFVWFDNYLFVLEDPLFWESFRQALVWTGISTLAQAVIGVGLALLLHQPLRGINAFRGLLLFPYIVPTVVIALNWRWLFNAEIGIVNHLLLSAGIISERVAWLSTPDMAMASAILLNVWKYTPFVVIVVLARLQTIPTELYDAAKVDGAGAIRRFRDITLPQLAEVLAVVVVFRTIWTFNKFEEIYLLTRGGPGTSTYNLALYAFDQAMANLRMGVGAASGVIMLGLLLAGSLLYIRLTGFGREDRAA